MNKPPAYQHYAKDWLVGTAQLTLEEQGAFQRLLDHQWERGPLEHDPKALARLLGVSVRTFGRLWKQLAPHFPASSNGHGRQVANIRLEEQRAELAAYRAQQVAAGQARGRAITAAAEQRRRSRDTPGT